MIKRLKKQKKPMKKPLLLTDNNFQKEVISSEVPVLVDFWASWCPPCKMVDPVVNDLAARFDGAIKIAKLNVDHNPKTAAEYNIIGVPTFVIFRSGEVIAQCVGSQSKQQIEELLRKKEII